MADKYKYESLMKYIKAEIDSEKLKPDDRVPSEPEISKKFNLSRNTIRQAMRELELLGYLYRIQGKGTFVASKHIKQSNKIALVLYDLMYATHPFTSEMIKGIGDVLSKEGYALEILATGEFASINEELKDNSRYAGYIIGAYQTDREFIASIIAEDIPFVFAKNYIPGLKINAILMDYEKAGYMAAEHLLSLGHRNIALLNAGEIAISKEFTTGVEKAFTKFKAKLDENDIFNVGFAPENVVEYNHKLTAYTGIITLNDNIAIEAIKQLKQSAKNIPEDISVIGCNDIPAASMVTPELTTVKLPINELGCKSAEKLIDIINGKPDHDNIVLSPELVIRHSTSMIKSNKGVA
jgi:GntR family transcriptional regulator, arabinose operon transcriptional repressor